MADRRRHPGWAAALLAGLLAGCAGSPTTFETPDGPVSPSSAPTATPIVAAPTPAASAPPPLAVGPSEPPHDSLPKRASVARDGVRMTVEIGLNPIQSGQQNVITTTIKNTGHDTVHWAGGCAGDVWASAELTGTQWRESTIPIEPLLRGHSDWLQAGAYVDRPITLKFVPGRLIGQAEDHCPYGPDGRLKPGQSRTGELLWDGQAMFRLGPPPSSSAVITATFDHWYRDSDEASGRHRKPIVVNLDSWVVGGPEPAFLSPKEAIDAALADPVFGAWALTQPFTLRRTGVVEFDSALDVWIVGLIHEKDFPEPSLLHAALVDPLTGKVIAIRESNAY
jgi:hypothetical protein